MASLRGSRTALSNTGPNEIDDGDNDNDNDNNKGLYVWRVSSRLV